MIHASKNLDKERASPLNIDYTNLSQGAILGTAELYDVKEYKSKAEFVKDRNKHFADIKKFGSYRFGFMVKNAHKFRTPKPYPGRLRFFEVQYPVCLVNST